MAKEKKSPAQKAFRLGHHVGRQQGIQEGRQQAAPTVKKLGLRGPVDVRKRGGK